MRRRANSFDLIFGVIALIAEVVEENNRNKVRRGISSYNKSANKGPAAALNSLQQMENDHKTGGGPVYDPLKNKPVKTVSKEDRMAAFAAIKSGKTYTKTETTEDTTKEDEYSYIVNSVGRQAKLEILLLGYMFEEDDGKISRKERKAIQNHYRKSSNSLDKEDIEYIKDLKDHDNSLINIRAFISQQDVTDTEITNSIRTIKEISKNNKKYDTIINRIENSLLESMGY